MARPYVMIGSKLMGEQEIQSSAVLLRPPASGHWCLLKVAAQSHYICRVAVQRRYSRGISRLLAIRQIKIRRSKRRPKTLLKVALDLGKMQVHRTS